MTPAQVDQLFQFLLREQSMRDYLKLYPDLQARFGAVLAALPESVIADTVALLEAAQIPPTRVEKLARAFELTAAESAVALLLMAGHGLAEIADIRQISRNTARNHLQCVFEKTQTTRQPELIRRLHDVLKEQ